MEVIKMEVLRQRFWKIRRKICWLMSQQLYVSKKEYYKLEMKIIRLKEIDKKITDRMRRRKYD
jgi:hypothetical protein